ncbi:hypothetical protein GCM10027566_21370 [Arachidicoccus ginsenosidivorans]|jgi:hypothetical protein|uniref:6-bladed beta-propeller n=1 Tax=Arachidicoccus ginsenosidivorans TaxID=496057 RepID=A0A5B8VKL8_9BACT|nr:hypothetical protein [Arachidicoccus ginsenosidivorans]QEC72134.1 hypothetical protein FSB73_11085 [Arachidicoccus ginsenosidivorans]
MGAVNISKHTEGIDAAALLTTLLRLGKEKCRYGHRYRKAAFCNPFMVICMLLILQLLVVPVTGSAQSEHVERLNDSGVIPTQTALAIRGHFKHVELDKLGNLFLLGTNGSQFTEYNKKGDSINHYDNISSYGQLSELDVSNPLKLAVYYRDYATIVVLDRFLSPVNTIDLRKAGIWEAQTIATSYDNQYWVYDKQEARIKKVNGQGKVTFASSDLRQVFDDGLDPVRLLDRDGLLYAYDPGYGWYIFDYYGALKQKIPVKGLRDVSVTDGILTARIQVAGKDQLWLMDPNRLAAAPLQENLPDAASSGLGTIRQSLFIGSTGKLLLLTDAGLSTLFIGTR